MPPVSPRHNLSNMTAEPRRSFRFPPTAQLDLAEKRVKLQRVDARLPCALRSWPSTAGRGCSGRARRAFHRAGERDRRDITPADETRSEGGALEMHQIRYFLSVGETLNLTKAAERCNVAQPSLTRAIKALEAELGGELLRRERSLSHLTELGQRMLPMLRQCYEAALTAKTVAASINTGDIAPLTVAVSRAVALSPFAPTLRELSRALPGLQLKLRRGSSGEVAESLKAGSVELAIAGPLAEGWSRLDAFPLFDEPFDLVVSETHRLAARNTVEVKDLASETLLVNTGCEMAEQLSARLAAQGILDTAAHQAATQEDLLTLVKANVGVAVIPAAVEMSGLRRIRLKELNLTRVVSAYVVAGRRRSVACATLLNLGGNRHASTLD
jgi:DNA-binding transcriptional LysR family regulator